MSVHVLVHDKHCTLVNFIVGSIPPVLPKHHEVITFHVDSTQQYLYLFYLKQYLFFYHHMRKCGNVYSGCGNVMRESLYKFDERWRSIGYRKDLSFYKNLLYLLLDGLPSDVEPYTDLRVLTRTNCAHLLRDCIIDFLLPRDIFKLCMLSHDYYDLLYDRLAGMKQYDLQPRKLARYGLQSYSNGYIPDDPELQHGLLQSFIYSFVEGSEATYISETLPYPFTTIVKRWNIPCSASSVIERYAHAILGGRNSQAIMLAMHGYWTDTTREWVRELFVPDVNRHVQYSYKVRNTQPRWDQSVEFDTKHVDTIVSAVFDEFNMQLRSNITGDAGGSVNTMLTVDGQYVSRYETFTTDHGVFTTGSDGLSVYGGMSIYDINAHRSSGYECPEHLFDYRGDEPGRKGKYLWGHRWLMGDPNETFSYIVTWDEKDTKPIGLEIVSNDYVAKGVPLDDGSLLLDDPRESFSIIARWDDNVNIGSLSIRDKYETKRCPRCERAEERCNNQLVLDNG